MRRTLSIFCGLLIFAATGTGQTHYGTTDVKTFRAGRDAEFRNRSESPLLDEDFANFKGLSYFETSDKFVVTAKLERGAGTEKFVLPTSAGTTRKYLKYGTLKFEIDGGEFALTVFQPESMPKAAEFADLLFVPFRDLTNGKETYGGGRYIDLKTPVSETVVVNFNLAYNPNCAYGSDRYSCPVPPKENFLQIKIFAGERNFEHAPTL